jgi:hypothetical protein
VAVRAAPERILLALLIVDDKIADVERPTLGAHATIAALDQADRHGLVLRGRLDPDPGAELEIQIFDQGARDQARLADWKSGATVEDLGERAKISVETDAARALFRAL